MTSIRDTMKTAAEILRVYAHETILRKKRHPNLMHADVWEMADNLEAAAEENKPDKREALEAWNTAYDFIAGEVFDQHELVGLDEKIRRALSEPDWRPIETAPKDGRSIIVYGETHNSLQSESIGPLQARYTESLDAWVAAVEDDTGYSHEIIQATRWMPFPAVPDDERSE